MAKFQARFFPRDKNTYLITVTSYREKHLCGYFHRICDAETVPFSGLMQLTLLLEDNMDQGDRPQRDMEARAFRPGEAPAWRASAQGERTPGPALATFTVSIIFRRNASWQGTLIWNDCHLEAHFRSALELFLLMDNALTAPSD